MTKPDTQQNQFAVSGGPHRRHWLSVRRMMYITLMALLLPAAAAIYFFGYYALSIIAVSVASALITEYLVKRLRVKPFVMDGSAIVIGLLLALLMPPTIPLWMVAVGAFFAVAIVKEAFGGLGHYIFNPVLGGVAFMYACFQAEMTSWVAPTGFSWQTTGAAAPLSDAFAAETSKLAMLLGDTSGTIGETSALLILIAGIALIALRVIDWRIPLAYLLTTFVFSAILGADPLFQLLGGSLMLAAFFLATDWVTSPLTHKGKLLFGIGAGILVVLIRLYGSMPEGVAYSILLMNAFTPLIDRYLKPKPHGFKKAVKGDA